MLLSTVITHFKKYGWVLLAIGVKILLSGGARGKPNAYKRGSRRISTVVPLEDDI